MGSLPGWVVLASPIVALLSSVVSASVAVIAIGFNNRNQREQRRLQQGMQRLDLEERSLSTLRDERIKAYSTLARLSKAIWLEAPEDPLPTLYEALSQVEILTEDPKLKDVAEELVDKWTSAWESAHGARRRGDSPFDTPVFKNTEGLLVGLRNAFIELAKNEIGVKSPSHKELPKGSIPGETLPGPETGTSRP